MTVLRRFAPAAAPILYAVAWAVVLTVLSIPSVMDWRLILLIVLLGGAVGGLQAAPLVAPQLREWGIGAGILGVMLAPFGMSVTVLSLFTYRSGDLGPGWEQSETLLPGLAAQVLAAAVVITGLAFQRAGATPARHRRGRWLVLAGTLIGTSVLAAHLCAVAFDAAAAS